MTNDKIHLEKLPFPIATIWERYLNETMPLSRFVTWINLNETIIKYLSVISISSYLRGIRATDRITGDIVANLGRPSLGNWLSFLRSIVDLYSEFPAEFHSREVLEIVCGGAHRNGGLKKGERLKHFDQFVKTRNDFAHGGKPSDDQCTQAIESCQDNLYALGRDLETLACYPLVFIDRIENDGTSHCANLQGPSIRRSLDQEKFSVPVLPGQLYMRAPKGHMFSLHPLLTCQLDAAKEGPFDVFFFDKKKTNSITFFEYRENRRFDSIECLNALTSLFPAIEAGEVREELSFEKRMQDLSRLFIDRKEEMERLSGWAEAGAGYYAVFGERGSGKSALLANWVDGKDGVIALFPEAQEAKLDTSRYLIHVCEQLNQKYQLRRLVPVSPDLLPRTIEAMIIEAAQKSGNKRIVFVIDQFDDFEGFTELFPQELPQKVVIIVAIQNDTVLPCPPADSSEVFPLSQTQLLEMVHAGGKAHGLSDKDEGLILQAAAGDMEYVQTLFSDIEHGLVAKNELDRLPLSLESRWGKALANLIGDGMNSSPAIAILCLIACAREPLPLDTMAEIVGESEAAILVLASELRLFLNSGESVVSRGLTIRIERLRQFLLQHLPASALLHAHELLAAWYGQWQEMAGPASILNLPHHLMCSNKVTQLARLLGGSFLLELTRRTGTQRWALHWLKETIKKAVGNIPRMDIITLAYRSSLLKSASGQTLTQGHFQVLAGLGAVDRLLSLQELAETDETRAAILIAAVHGLVDEDPERGHRILQDAASLLKSIRERNPDADLDDLLLDCAGLLSGVDWTTAGQCLDLIKDPDVVIDAAREMMRHRPPAEMKFPDKMVELFPYILIPAAEVLVAYDRALAWQVLNQAQLQPEILCWRPIAVFIKKTGGAQAWFNQIAQLPLARRAGLILFLGPEIVQLDAGQRDRLAEGMEQALRLIPKGSDVNVLVWGAIALIRGPSCENSQIYMKLLIQMERTATCPKWIRVIRYIGVKGQQLAEFLHLPDFIGDRFLDMEMFGDEFARSGINQLYAGLAHGIWLASEGRGREAIAVIGKIDLSGFGRDGDEILGGLAFEAIGLWQDAFREGINWADLPQKSGANILRSLLAMRAFGQNRDSAAAIYKEIREKVYPEVEAALIEAIAERDIPGALQMVARIGNSIPWRQRLVFDINPLEMVRRRVIAYILDKVDPEGMAKLSETIADPATFSGLGLFGAQVERAQRDLEAALALKKAETNPSELIRFVQEYPEMGQASDRMRDLCQKWSQRERNILVQEFEQFFFNSIPEKSGLAGAGGKSFLGAAVAFAFKSNAESGIAFAKEVAQISGHDISQLLAEAVKHCASLAETSFRLLVEQMNLGDLPKELLRDVGRDLLGKNPWTGILWTSLLPPEMAWTQGEILEGLFDSVINNLTLLEHMANKTGEILDTSLKSMPKEGYGLYAMLFAVFSDKAGDNPDLASRYKKIAMEKAGHIADVDIADTVWSFIVGRLACWYPSEAASWVKKIRSETDRESARRSAALAVLGTDPEWALRILFDGVPERDRTHEIEAVFKPLYLPSIHDRWQEKLMKISPASFIRVIELIREWHDDFSATQAILSIACVFAKNDLESAELAVYGLADHHNPRDKVRLSAAHALAVSDPEKARKILAGIDLKNNWGEIADYEKYAVAALILGSTYEVDREKALSEVREIIGFIEKDRSPELWEKVIINVILSLTSHAPEECLGIIETASKLGVSQETALAVWLKNLPQDKWELVSRGTRTISDPRRRIENLREYARRADAITTDEALARVLEVIADLPDLEFMGVLSELLELADPKTVAIPVEELVRSLFAAENDLRVRK